MNKQPTFLSKIKSIFTSSSIEETGLQEGETEVKRKYDDDGNLELEEYFKNGEKVREVIFGETPRKGIKDIPYNEGFFKSEETHFKNGKKVGYITFFYSGAKRTETLFENEKIIKRTEFYETGEVDNIVSYENGIPVSEIGFDKSGGKCSEGNYENGEMLDLTFFDVSGHKEREQFYKNGRIFRRTEIYITGTIVSDEFYDISDYRKYGERVRRNWFYYTGEKWGETVFEEGKPVKTTEFYESGIKKSEKHFKNEIANGLWSEWDEDGKITFRGNFVDGNQE